MSERLPKAMGGSRQADDKEHCKWGRRPAAPVGSAVVLLLCTAAIIVAQPHTYVSGLIRDPSDAAVPGAALTVVNEDTGFRRSTASGPDGSYAVAALEPGTYRITVRKEGFRTMIRVGVRLMLGQPSRIDFELPLGSMQETVTVEGLRTAVVQNDVSLGTLVTHDQIESVPANGRNFLSLLELTAGTVVTPATRGEAGQFSAGGQRPNSNYFTVDGVSVNTGVSAGGSPARNTGGSLPGMTAIGSLHGLLPLDAADEFRVETSSTSAEFGRLPGAQVVMTSRSGSNELHGSLFEAMRNTPLAANDWFSNSRGVRRSQLSIHDFGASMGGPVQRNRTFFYASYEGLRLKQPFSWRSAVPDRQVRLESADWVQPLLGLFPVPNGRALESGTAEWTGLNTRPSRLDTGNLRIDHALTSRITLFGRYNRTPSWSEYNGTQLNRIAMDSRSATLGLNVRFRPAVLFELRMNYSDAKLDSEWGNLPTASCVLTPVAQRLLRIDDACGVLLRFSIAGIGNVVSGREPDQTQSQRHFAPSLSIGSGSHQLRIGGDYRRLDPRRRDWSSSVGVIAEAVSDMVTGQNLWVTLNTQRAVDTTLAEGSVYAQDSWRVHSRLTALFGVRWELSASPRLKQAVYPSDPLPLYVFKDQEQMWAKPFGNVGWRAGLAWRPAANGRTVVRAGAGLYFDSSFSVATDLVNGGPFSMSQFGSAVHAPFTTVMSYGFEPGLRLPSVGQWNATIEHAFDDANVVTASYTGARGRDLLRREVGGPGNTETLRLALATNNARSSYHAMQWQYRLRATRGLTGLLSYTWSHSIDNSSSDSVLQWAGAGVTATTDRGSSDFDVRHLFSGALTYRVPWRNRWIRDWQWDGIFRARSGFPLTVLNSEYAMGLTFANAFRPNLAPGQPVWLSDGSAAGGRRLNPAAFVTAGQRVQGNLGRNAIAGLGMSQVDLALSRDFRFGERRGLVFRVEAFNALNHPNFADPVRFLSSPLFGAAPSMLNLMLGSGSPGSGLTPAFQSGGPRAVQLQLRLRF